MNIFASFPCPERSARILDDSRIIKMPLESCQLMATTAARLNRWVAPMPRPTHAHHPLVDWVGAGRLNFEWLWNHALAMDQERRDRFGNPSRHKTMAACDKAKIWRLASRLPSGSTPFVNCARNKNLGIDFTHLEVHLAYRSYLVARWRSQMRPAICTIAGLLDKGPNWRT